MAGGVDHQIVVDVVEENEVGEEHTELLEKVAPLDVAGDHGHLDVGAHR
jgi:hypothetical protein